MIPSVDDIPVCPVDPEELRRLAASVEAAGSATKPSADRILLTWGLLSSVYRSPEAPELRQSLRLLDPAAAEIDTGLRRARSALETLADDLEAVNRRRDALVDELHDLSATEALAFPEPADDLGRRLHDAAQADREAAFRRRCAALFDGWDAA
ncbi:hypothetical protein, partial [uncultured Microbacterium sp.]|uniref:hypothetical protein n=1 Tax=uncultured Microbacterium sp. TaxID=191216 RepID=UPI0028D51ECA